MTRFLLSICLLTALAGRVSAGPLEDGFAAFDRREWATAMQLLRPPAEQGNAEAQLKLAVLYSNGFGVPEDHREAMKWYRLSAEQGNAVAQHGVGYLYRYALGVEPNRDEAVKWLRKAAAQANADAAKLLAELEPMTNASLALQIVERERYYGYAYLNGTGVDKSYALAVSRFRYAAERGNADSQSMLGILYENGEGIPKDYAEAAKWHRMAAENGERNSQNHLGRLYAYGLGVPKDMQEAVKWLSLGTAREGYPDDKRFLEEIRHFLPETVSADIAAAEEAIKGRDYDTAANLLDRVLSPNNPAAPTGAQRARALIAAGHAHSSLGFQGSAISLLQQALKLDPASVEAKRYLEVATASLKDRQRREADKLAAQQAAEEEKEAMRTWRPAASSSYENSGVKTLIDKTNTTLGNQRKENCAAAAQGADRSCVR